MSKEPRYTKGDWWVDLTPEDKGYHVAAAGEEKAGESIAFAFFTENKETSLANAHLIAAAPDMYDKLTKVKKWLERQINYAEHQLITCRFITLREAYEADIKNYRATIEDIEQALNKVEGKS